jgi:hypothetical protein
MVAIWCMITYFQLIQNFDINTIESFNNLFATMLTIAVDLSFRFEFMRKDVELGFRLD